MAKKKKVTKKSASRVSAAAKIDSIYSALITRLEKAESFTLEHAPDVCKEIVESKVVMYQNKAIESFLSLVLTLTGIALGTFIVYKGTFIDRMCESHCVSVELYYTLGGVLLLGSLLGSLCHISCIVSSLLEIREINVSKKLTVLRGLKYLVGGRR